MKKCRQYSSVRADLTSFFPQPYPRYAMYSSGTRGESRTVLHLQGRGLW